MNSTARTFCILGGLLDSFNSAVAYHFYHALGLFAVAFVAIQLPASSLPKVAGWLMVVGIMLFSGSIYLMTLGAPTIVVMAAPLGGISFMIAWLLLAVAAFKSGPTS
jgi:uncharacterized membrane protein YgdD (TMEM256/DUF423 family)